MLKTVIANEVDNETIIRIAHLYLATERTTLANVSELMGISQKVLSKILYRGIAENILSDAISEQVYHHIVNAFSNGIRQRRKRWDKAFEERAIAKKQKHIAYYEAQKEEMQNILDSVDSYGFDEEDAPSKKDIERKIFFIEKHLIELKHVKYIK